MSITEKPFKKDFNQFILPSQTIINYDLTCNSSSGIHDPSLIYAEQIDSNKNIKLQHNNDLIMMAHASSDSSIWVPADKHPQIAPNEYENWIKTYTIANQPNVNTSRRKRSVLSNVSFNSTEEQEEDDSDTSEEDEPITPTLTESTVLSRDIQSLPVMQIKDNSKDGRKDINNGQQESCFDLVTPSNSIPNKTREPKEDDIYIKDTIAAFPLPNSMNMHQFETRNTSCFTFENVNRTSPIHDLQKEYQPTKNSLHFDHQKTKKSSSWFKDLFTKKSEKPSIMAGLFSKNKQTSDTPNTSFIKKLSHSASSKSLNSLRKKQSTESALKRMPLPASLKKKQSTAPPPRPPRPPIVHTRYPVNTERAIYRLSHVKLSNARRPLRQQVVISNMMFWYLSITEKEQDDHFLEYQPQHQQQRGYYNNDIYQSFQPPASGNGAYPNYYAHQYHYYDSSCYPKLSSSPQRQPSVNEYASTTTVTEKNKLKKKKYKPVRNPQYSPSIASS